MEPTTIFIIGIIIVLSISICAVIVAIVSLNKHSSNTDNTVSKKDFDEFKESISKVISSQAQTLNTGNRGLHGPRGPSGPQGPPGMSYSAAGQLLNMAMKTVATPTAGKGTQSIIYLDNKNNSPMQYWFLENNLDGTVSVKNKYSDRCLNTDGGNNVFSDVCRDDNNQKFVWNSQMQLLSKGQNGKCMSIQDFSRNTGNSTNNLDPTTGQALTNTNNGNVKRVALDVCSSSLNPNQTWFVGN
jgi:hypothetical protein